MTMKVTKKGIAAEIITFLHCQSKRPPHWNSFSQFRFRPYHRNQHESGCQISSKSDHSQRSYDVIFIFKMAAAAANFYFRFRIGGRPTLQNFSLYQQNQILLEYLNPQLRYNYFQFGKTIVRHIGILLPVSISTISP